MKRDPLIPICLHCFLSGLLIGLAIMLFAGSAGKNVAGVILLSVGIFVAIESTFNSKES